MGVQINRLPGKFAFALIVCSLVLASLACGSDTSTTTTTPEESAWYACTLFVQRQYGVSTSKAERYNRSEVRAFQNGLYTANVYYASLGETYVCGLTQTDSGDWALLQIGPK